MQKSVNYNYKIFDFSFSLASDFAQALCLFDLVYKNFRQKNGKQLSHTFEVVTNHKSGGTPHLKAEERRYPFNSFFPVESQCFKLITDEINKNINSHFLTHGGGAVFQNKGVMICGDSGTGKTSLIMKLLTCGFQFLSDEIIPINKKTGMMEPFPRAVGLRSDIRALLRDEFSLFRELEFNRTSGHKYFMNPSLLPSEKIGAPAVPVYFIYLAKPQSSSENKTVVHVVIEAGGQDFLSSLEGIDGLRVIECIQKQNYIYVKIEMLREASVIKKYLKLFEKFKSFIGHTEKEKEKGIRFNKTPKIRHLPLHDISLLLLKQLKKGIIKYNSDGERLKSIGHYWLNLVKTLNIAEGYEIQVGRMEDTVRFVQDLTK